MLNVFGAISKFSVSFFSGVVVGLPIYITVTDYLFCIARVEGTSMQPTLNPKVKEKPDVVFLDKWNTNVEQVHRGDVVAISSPHNHNISFIKRVVGLEGDVVETPRYRHSYVFIPRGHCWVEGDNSRASLDSNSFGPISLGLVKGKATHIVWPPKRWQRLDQNLPEHRKPTNLHDLNSRINIHVDKKLNLTNKKKEPKFKMSVELDEPLDISEEEVKKDIITATKEEVKKDIITATKEKVKKDIITATKEKVKKDIITATKVKNQTEINDVKLLD